MERAGGCGREREGAVGSGGERWGEGAYVGFEHPVLADQRFELTEQAVHHGHHLRGAPPGAEGSNLPWGSVVAGAPPLRGAAASCR